VLPRDYYDSKRCLRQDAKSYTATCGAIGARDGQIGRNPTFLSSTMTARDGQIGGDPAGGGYRAKPRGCFAGV